MYTARYRAYAKINLILNVVGKRPDGYHELESVMQAVSLCDDVTVRLRHGACGAGSAAMRHGACGAGAAALRHGGSGAGSVGVTVDTDDAYIAAQSIPDDGRNTAYRAAEAYFARLAPRGGWRADIHIRKRIPAAAGLAGGSADAAAALRALNDIAAQSRGMDGVRPLTEAELLDAALSVGADVPFCLAYGTERVDGGSAPHTAFAAGVGEKLRRVANAPPKYAVALVNPRIEVSTARVFAAYSPPSEYETEKISKLTRAMIESHNEDWTRCYNALERSVTELHPEIGRLKAALLEAGALCAVMSGAGPTVYGLFDTVDGAARAADVIRGDGAWAIACSLI